MKKLTFKTTAIIAGLTLVCSVWFTSCHLPPTEEQLAKTNTWNKLFSAEATHMRPNRIVCRSLSEESMAAYKTLYSTPNTPAGVASMMKAYTESVTFGGQDLGNWIDDITTNTDVDSIKICFGIYTPHMIGSFPTELRGKAGRLTVFLKAVAKNKKNAVFTHPSTYPGGLSDGCSLTGVQPMAVGDTTDNFNLGSVYP